MTTRKRLDDLQAQRARIAEHLAWLDAEIARERDEHQPPSPASPPNSTADTATEPPAPEQSPDAATAATAGESPAPLTFPGGNERTADLARNTRMGCLVLAALACGLALLALFGLPYLIF